jgi:hypothetical protein
VTAAVEEKQRVAANLDRLLRIASVLERHLRAHDGTDWLEAAKSRRRGAGREVSERAGMHDPRFLTALIAFDPVLAGLFSESDRQAARKLSGMANSVQHNDLDKLYAGDGDRAEQIVTQLIAAAQKAPVPAGGETPSPTTTTRSVSSHPIAPPPVASEPGIQAEDRVAAAVAEAQREIQRKHKRAEEAQRANETRLRDGQARALYLRETLTTFREVMAAAGNPGAVSATKSVPHPKPLSKGVRYEKGTVRGWSLGREEGGHRSHFWLFLDTDGRLWRQTEASQTDTPGTLIERLDADVLEHSGLTAAGIEDIDGIVIRGIGRVMAESGLDWPGDPLEDPDRRSGAEREQQARLQRTAERLKQKERQEQLVANLRQWGPWFGFPLVGAIVAQFLFHDQGATIIGLFVGFGIIARCRRLTLILRGRPVSSNHSPGPYEVILGAFWGGLLGLIVALYSGSL